MADLGTEWEQPSLAGPRLTGAANYIGRHAQDTIGTVADHVDAGIRYETRIDGKPPTLCAGVATLFDRQLIRSGIA